jgi:hypothetical protein
MKSEVVMNIRHVLLLVLPALLAAPSWAAPATQPTTTAPSTAAAFVTPLDGYLTEAQLVQAFRSHDYTTVLRETMRIQSVPAVSLHYKLFNLMVLRAESNLQLKNVPAAIEGFTHAATLTEDVDPKSVMLATVLLLREQHGLKYLSRTTDEHGTPIPNAAVLHKPAPIDVLDLRQRTIAFRALCCDKVAAATQMTGKIYRDIAALKPLIALVQDVSVAERAADGQQIETQKLQSKTGQIAGLIINNALKSMTRRADEYQVAADSLINPGNYANNGLRNRFSSPQNSNFQPSVPRGLTTQQANDLLAMEQTAQQVPKVTQQLTDDLNLDAKYFDSLKDVAKTLAKLAQDILDKDPIRNNP